MNWTCKKESLDNWPGFSNKTLVYPGEEKVWDKDTQAVVIGSIQKQYNELGLDASDALNSLNSPTATTVTTGHQLQLLGGPAFLHYKTIATIRKAKALEAELGTPVVPVFWMATEDHDFAEISWVWGREQKFYWDYPSDIEKLPVGVLPLTGLRDLVQAWLAEADLNSTDSSIILSCLTESENRKETYAKFFHRLMHAWYGDTGLIVIDAAAPELKAVGTDLFAAELNSKGIAPAVRSASEKLKSQGIKPQAHIRDINLFDINPNSPRLGIVDASVHLNTPPEHLSPGVLLRPLYQELLLPNRIVVLGPGEAAYWQQLDEAFAVKGITKPAIHLRDHVVWLNSQFEELKEWPNAVDLKSAFIESRIRELYSDQISAVEAALTSASDAMSSLAGDLDTSLDGARGAADAGMQKVWSGFLKKAKRAVRRSESAALLEIESAVRELVREGAPQDRWANLHVLSRCVGGFVNSRQKLLETHDSLEPVKIVFVESD